MLRNGLSLPVVVVIAVLHPFNPQLVEILEILC
jgi:hypothetical protein